MNKINFVREQMERRAFITKAAVRNGKYKKNLPGMVKMSAFKGNMEVTFRVMEVGFYRSADPSFVNIGASALHHLKTFEGHKYQWRNQMEE